MKSVLLVVGLCLASCMAMAMPADAGSMGGFELVMLDAMSDSGGDASAGLNTVVEAESSADAALIAAVQGGMAAIWGADTAALVFQVLFLVIGVWATVRQFIPPKWLTWMPDWLIKLLERLAMNSRYSSNEFDPIYFKRRS